MKSSKTLLAIVALSFAAAGFAFAADKAENKAGKCCANAAKEGKACSHGCCVEAAKAGNNCTKCGGSGKIEKKADAKK
jgi:hypothetical protein